MQQTYTNTAQLVYNYLLHSNSSKRTAASIAANTQLTVQQVCSALQNLQKRKLVTANKQQSKRTQYSAVITQAAVFTQFKYVQREITYVARTAQAQHTAVQHTAAAQQQVSFMQRIAQAFKRML